MSDLRKALEEYLAVRRALGFKLRESGTRLEKFVSFLESQGEAVITTQLAVAWAQRDPHVQPAQWTANLTAIRLFAQYCSGIDPRNEIPAPGILPHRYRRKAPHIYTPDETASLLEAARRLRPHAGLRPRTFTTLFGLLAATGLRVGEAVGLHRDDVDVNQGMLTVRYTKFGKTRLVPLHISTLEALSDYARRRDKLHPVPRTPGSSSANRAGAWTCGGYVPPSSSCRAR